MFYKVIICITLRIILSKYINKYLRKITLYIMIIYNNELYYVTIFKQIIVENNCHIYRQQKIMKDKNSIKIF